MTKDKPTSAVARFQQRVRGFYYRQMKRYIEGGGDVKLPDGREMLRDIQRAHGLNKARKP